MCVSRLLYDDHVAYQQAHHLCWQHTAVHQVGGGAVYASIMLIGAGINFLIYAWPLVNNGLVQSYPTLGVAAGSGIDLVWNFFIARAVLYRRSA